MVATTKYHSQGEIMKTVSIILKDSLIKACVCFTVMILIMNIIALHLATSAFSVRLGLNITGWLTTSLLFMFALASFLAGAAAQVHKITKIPAFSRHIIHFILNYGIFFIVIIPMSNHPINSGTTLFLSVVFIAIYLVIFGIYAGIKAIINRSRNKKLKYDAVYKDAK